MQRTLFILPCRNTKCDIELYLMAPHTPWSLRWGLCVVGECIPDDDAHQVYAIYGTSITRIQTQPTLITEDNRPPFHSPVDSFATTNLPCLTVSWCTVCGGLARGTHVLSPAANRSFPSATCARITSLDAATAARTMRRTWRASIIRRRPKLGLQVWDCSTDHCWQQRHTTNMCCNPSICPASFPQAYNVIPFKWFKLFNRSTYSSAGKSCTIEWMLQTLFTSESTTVNACRIKPEGAKQASWAPSDRRWLWQMNQ